MASEIDGLAKIDSVIYLGSVYHYYASCQVPILLSAMHADEIRGSLIWGFVNLVICASAS